MFGPHEATAAGSPSRVTDAHCCSRPLFILYSLRCCHNLIEVRLHGHFFKPFRYAIECADINRTDSHTQVCYGHDPGSFQCRRVVLLLAACVLHFPLRLSQMQFVMRAPVAAETGSGFSAVRRFLCSINHLCTINERGAHEARQHRRPRLARNDPTTAARHRGKAHCELSPIHFIAKKHVAMRAPCTHCTAAPVLCTGAL
jgi:hypothetical protein|mmetsp:Transcript_1840/g.3479  ORF Transcript_1840/g.3479 Transcript_1840/m.3479 type:complete len:200 (-) Transcript_1840:445-1044(-)